MTDLKPIDHAPRDAVERLLDAAFGPGRHARTAYRVRAGLHPIGELSFAAFDGGRLVGSLQSWPVALTTPDGGRADLVMVGPVGVLPELQGAGIGKAMLGEIAARLDAKQLPAMLIGDEAYYRPYGFVSGPAARWILPGPAEPHRILLRSPGRALPAEGSLGPALLR